MLKRLLIALIIGIGIPAILMPFIEQGLRRFDRPKFDKLDEIISGNRDFDLVFFGSSRSYIHYHPGIFDSVLHLNSFNAGTEGAIHGETDVLFRQYLVHHPNPRVMVVNVDLAMFAFPDRIFNPGSYYPYLHEPVIAEYLFKKDPFSRGIYYLPFLALTRYDDYMRGNAIKGILGKTAPYSRYHYKGYIEFSKLQVVDTIHGPPPLKQDVLYEQAFEFFVRWNELCRLRGIRFFAVFSPYHRLYYKTYPWQVDYRRRIIEKLANTGVPVIDMESREFRNQQALFSDAIHLNRNGARLFSTMLADSLKARL